MLIRKAIKVNQEIWDKLTEVAKLADRPSRNDLINSVFERLCKMNREELLRFLYPEL